MKQQRSRQQPATLLQTLISTAIFKAADRKVPVVLTVIDAVRIDPIPIAVVPVLASAVLASAVLDDRMSAGRVLVPVRNRWSDGWRTSSANWMTRCVNCAN